MLPYLHKVTADGEGRFKFEGLHPGKYYAYSHISWEVVGKAGLTPTGGWVGAEVTVREEPLNVILKEVR